MTDQGFCILHLGMRRDPLDPGRVLVPESEEWMDAERFAAEHAVTWWDANPVFVTREEAEGYAWLAPIETTLVAVEYTAEEVTGEEGWFDSFRSPHRFRVCPS